tara:strand:+ start:8635 stop:9603 length:969 start_codon:yes stop_codon:yes gene_type:complete
LKIKQLHITLLLIAFISIGTLAQKKSVKGYRIDGDEIVFTFDKREYMKITDDKSQKRMDFDDFDIKNVVVSGEFNSWSKNSWKMKKVDENIYELRKKISAFDDDFEWEFKFIVNNNFWAEPSESITNITPAIKHNGQILDTYNLKFINAYVSENGNTKFILDDYLNAEKVVLAGSFNRWDESLFKMKKTGSGWELTLELRPDVYEYKFIVDGKWIEDSKNPDRALNEFDEYNSIIKVKKDVTFLLYNFKNAKNVILAGDFNNWSENEFQMRKTENGWTYTLPLTGGKYHYKYIVDGKWIVDPDNSVREYDEKGHINSVKMVR